MIDKAQSLGLFMALVATWGDKVRKACGEGPEIFNEKNALPYGKWLGNRFTRITPRWATAQGSTRTVSSGTASPVALRRGFRHHCLRQLRQGLYRRHTAVSAGCTKRPPRQVVARRSPRINVWESRWWGGRPALPVFALAARTRAVGPCAAVTTIPAVGGSPTRWLDMSISSHSGPGLSGSSRMSA
ncbi:MAG: apiosidase-like domain-containing protein [Planctomycetota bacterium]